MTGLFTDPVEVNRRLVLLGLDAYPAPTRQVFGTTMEETWVRNPLPSLLRDFDEGVYDPTAANYNTAIPTYFRDKLRQEGRMLSREEANARFGIAGELSFTTPEIPDFVAEQLHGLKRDELRRRNIFQRAQGGFAETSGRLAIGFLTSALDPINVASAFIPVVGPARYAIWVERLGAPAARLARGTIEGAVGAAVVEPIVLMQARREQADYGAMDSLLNIAFGTALGGGLHVAAGWLADRLAGARAPMPGELSRMVEAAPPASREAALRGAVAAVAEGRPVRIESAFARELMSSSTAGGRTPEIPAAALRDDLAPPAEAAPAAESIPLSVPMIRNDGMPRVFGDRRAAEEMAQRLSRGGATRASVAELPDGRFVLRQASAAQAVLGSDGLPLAFKSERAAQKAVRTWPQFAGRDLDTVPLPGGRGVALIEGADERELAVLRQAPELAELGRAPDRSAAASLAADRQAREAERGERSRRLSRVIADVAAERRQEIERGFFAQGPEDRIAAAEVEARVAPTLRADENAVAETDAAQLEEDIAAMGARLDPEAMDAADAKALEEADELAAAAAVSGKLYEAAAFCLLRAA